MINTTIRIFSISSIQAQNRLVTADFVALHG